MSYFATCAGLPVVGGTLLIPLVGAWTADLYLATDQPVSGKAAVVIGNLTLQGFMFRSSAYGGQTRVRLVGGNGGWRRTIDSQGYGSNSGVKLSHIVGDAAAACGETVSVPHDTTVGPAYTRADAPASDVLWQLVAMGTIPAWRIDQSGTTQINAWPSATIASQFDVIDQRPEDGLVIVATEDYASWMPGVSFSAPQLQGTLRSAGVNYVFNSSGKFRLEVLTGGVDRFLGALASFIDRKIAPLRFFGRYEYKVHNPSESTIDCSPVDDSIGLPELQGVPIAADAIAAYSPPEGGIAHIQFVNGIPSRPVCVWTEQKPTEANLLSGSLAVARLSDTVQSVVVATPPNLTGILQFAPQPPGPPTPMMTGTPYVIVPLASTLAILSPVSGTIVTGSQTVASE